MNQGQYRNRASFGKRQEYVVISELLRQGFDVYVPLVDDHQIDCIVRRGDNNYIDMQIKNRSKDCIPFDAGRFAAMNIPDPRDKFTSSSILSRHSATGYFLHSNWLSWHLRTSKERTPESITSTSPD